MSRTHKLRADNSDRFYQGVRYPAEEQFTFNAQEITRAKVPHCQFCTKPSTTKVEIPKVALKIYVCDDHECKDELATILTLRAIQANRRSRKT